MVGVFVIKFPFEFFRLDSLTVKLPSTMVISSRSTPVLAFVSFVM